MSNSTVIMIDGAYLDKILSLGFNKARVDLEKLALELVEDKNLLRTYYYHCPPYMSKYPTTEEIERSEGKERFFGALRAISKFEIRLGKLVFRGSTKDGKPIFVQKLIDVMLSVDMVRLAGTSNVSNIVLVAGDNDFVPAIKLAKELGVSVTVVHGPPIEERDNIHNDLWNICDLRIQMSEELIRKTKRS